MEERLEIFSIFLTFLDKKPSCSWLQSIVSGLISCYSVQLFNYFHKLLLTKQHIRQSSTMKKIRRGIFPKVFDLHELLQPADTTSPFRGYKNWAHCQTARKICSTFCAMQSVFDKNIFSEELKSIHGKNKILLNWNLTLA